GLDRSNSTANLASCVGKVSTARMAGSRQAKNGSNFYFFLCFWILVASQCAVATWSILAGQSCGRPISGDLCTACGNCLGDLVQPVARHCGTVAVSCSSIVMERNGRSHL